MSKQGKQTQKRSPRRPEGADAEMLDLSGSRAADGKLERALAGPRAHALRRLDLSRNRDAVGPELLRPLPLFSGQLRLRSLDLSDNSVRDLSPVLSLGTHLEELVATDNAVERLPRAVGRMQALRTLRLGHNRLRLLADIERLCVCPNLSVLVLEGNPLSEVEHYRALAVHKLRMVHILDDTAVLLEEREQAAARFGPDEVAALREEKMALEQQLTRAREEVSASKEHAAQTAREKEALVQQNAAEVTSTSARMSTGDADASIADGDKATMQQGQWSSPFGSHVEENSQFAPDLEASAVGTTVGANTSAVGTVVGDTSESPRDQANKHGAVDAVLSATIFEGLAELANCDARYAAVLEDRWDAPTAALQGFEPQVLRLLKREERDLRAFVQEQAGSTSLRTAVAAVQTMVVRQTINTLEGTADGISPHTTYLRTSAMAHEALRTVFQIEAGVPRADDSGIRETEMLIRRWQQTIGHLQKTLATYVAVGAEDSPEEQNPGDEPSDWVFPLAWRALADVKHEEDGKTRRLEGNLMALVDKNGSLEREIALLKETSATQLDSMRKQQAQQAAAAAQRTKALEEESDVLRHKIGLLPLEEVDDLNRENSSLNTRLSKLQMQHSKLEEDYATQLDLYDATVSKHRSELEHLKNELQERLVQAESSAARQTEEILADHSRAVENSHKHITGLESQIRQLEQQSTARLVRGTASLEELTRENDALTATCAKQASELSDLHRRLSITAEETPSEDRRDASEGDVAHLQAELLAMKAEYMSQIKQLETELADQRVISEANARCAREASQRETAHKFASAQELEDAVAVIRVEMADVQKESSEIQAAASNRIVELSSENAILQEQSQKRLSELGHQSDPYFDRLRKENQALRDQLAAGRTTVARTSVERSAYEASAGLIQNELQQFNLQLMKANEDLRDRTNSQIEQLMRQNEELQAQVLSLGSQTVPKTQPTSAPVESTGTQSEMSFRNIDEMVELNTQMRSEVQQLQREHADMRFAMSKQIKELEQANTILHAQATAQPLASTGRVDASPVEQNECVQQATAELHAQLAGKVKKLTQLEQDNTTLRKQLKAQDEHASHLAALASEADAALRALRTDFAQSQQENDRSHKSLSNQIADLRKMNEHLQQRVEPAETERLLDKLREQEWSAAETDATLQTARASIADLQEQQALSKAAMSARIVELEHANTDLQHQLSTQSQPSENSIQCTDDVENLQQLRQQNALLLTRLSSAEKVLIQTQALMEAGSGQALDISNDSVLRDLPHDEDLSVIIHTPAESIDGSDIADLERDNVVLRSTLADAMKEAKAAQTEFSRRLRELQQANGELTAQAAALTSENASLQQQLVESGSGKTNEAIERLSAQLIASEAIAAKFKSDAVAHGDERDAMKTALANLQATARSEREKLQQIKPQVRKLVGPEAECWSTVQLSGHMMLLDVLSVTSTLQSQNHALEALVEAGRNLEKQQTADIKAATERATTEAQRAAAAVSEVDRLRRTIEELQESLEQQQESGVQYRRELRDALSAKDLDIASQAQELQDTRAELRGAQQQLAAAHAALKAADTSNKELAKTVREQQQDLCTMQEDHNREMELSNAAWSDQVKKNDAEHLDKLRVVHQDTEARLRRAEKQHMQDIARINEQSQTTSADAQGKLQAVLEQYQTLCDDNSRCTEERQVLRQCLFLVVDLDDGAHATLKDMRAATNAELDRRRLQDKACREAEESARDGQSQLASLQRMHQQLVDASAVETKRLQQELDSARLESEQEQTRFTRNSDNASVEVERVVAANKTLTEANARIEAELKAMRIRVDHVNSVVGPTAEQLRHQIDELTSDAASEREKSIQALHRQEQLMVAEINALKQQHEAEMAAKLRELTQAKRHAQQLQDEVEILKQHSADSDARCRELAAQLDQVISSVSSSVETATDNSSGLAESLQAAIDTINDISTRLGEKNQTFEKMREQEALIGIARGNEEAADARCRALTERAALLRSEQRQALAQLSAQKAEVQRLRDRLKSSEQQLEHAHKTLQEERESNRVAINLAKDEAASSARLAEDFKRQMLRLQSQADIDLERYKESIETAERRLRHLDEEQNIQHQATAKDQERRLTELQTSLEASEERCQSLSDELATARNRENELLKSTESEQSKVDKLIAEHTSAIVLLQQETQLKLSTTQSKHDQTIEALREEQAKADNAIEKLETAKSEVEKWRRKAKDFNKNLRRVVRRADEHDHALRTARIDCDNTIREVRRECAAEIASAQSAARIAEQAVSDAKMTSERALQDLRCDVRRAEQAATTANLASEQSNSKLQEALSELTVSKRERSELMLERDAIKRDLSESEREIEQLRSSSDERKLSVQLQIARFDQQLAEAVQSNEMKLMAEHRATLQQAHEQHHREMLESREKVRKLEAHDHALQCELLKIQHENEEATRTAETVKRLLSQAEDAATVLRAELVNAAQRHDKALELNEQTVRSLNENIALLEEDKAELACEYEQLEQNLCNVVQNHEDNMKHELEDARLTQENLEMSLRDLRAETSSQMAQHKADLHAKNLDHERLKKEQDQIHQNEVRQLSVEHELAQQKHGVEVVQLKQQHMEHEATRLRQVRDFEARQQDLISNLQQAEQDKRALAEQLRVAHDKTRQLMSEMDLRNNEFQNEIKLWTDSVTRLQDEMKEVVARETRKYERQLVEAQELSDDDLRKAKRDYSRQLREADEAHEQKLAAQNTLANQRSEDASKQVAAMRLELADVRSDLNLKITELDRTSRLLETEQETACTSAAKASSTVAEAGRLRQQLRDESLGHREALESVRRESREEKERALDAATVHQTKERALRAELEEERMALQAAQEERDRSLAQLHDASIISDSRCEELIHEMSSIREDHSVERSSLLQCNHVVLESLQQVTERMDDIVARANTSHGQDNVLSQLQAEQYFSRLSAEVRELREVQSEAVDNATSGHETIDRDVIALSTRFNATIKSLVDKLQKTSHSDAAQSNSGTASAGVVVPLSHLESVLATQQESRTELSQCQQDLEEARAQLNVSAASLENAANQVDVLQAENDALQKQVAEITTVGAHGDGAQQLDAGPQTQDETQMPSDSQIEQVESEVQRQLRRLEVELGQAEERARAAEQQARANDDASRALSTSVLAAAEEHELQVSQLRSKLREKEDQLRALQEQHTRDAAANSMAAHEHEQALHAISAAHDEAMKCAQDKFLEGIRRAEGSVRDSEERCRGLAEEVASLRAKHAAASAESTLINAKQSRVESQLQEEQHRCTALMDEVTTLQNISKASSLEVSVLQQENTSLRAELSAQRAGSLETLAQESRESAQQLQHKAEQMAVLEVHVQELTTELDSARHKHKQECGNLQCELEEACKKAASDSKALLQLQTELRRATISNTSPGLEERATSSGLNVSSSESLTTSLPSAAPSSTLYPVVTQLLSAVSHHAAADGYGR